GLPIRPTTCPAATAIASVSIPEGVGRIPVTARTTSARNRNFMPLSVCLLTRNEEKNIARAVRSVAEAADEVLVADTGSTDRTVEIARSLGARVLDYAWNDDFGAARDYAIAHAGHDWILWLNPDEELIPESLAALRDCT